MRNKPRQAQPLTPEILLDILAYLDLTKRADLVFWVILLISFFGMLRKSNLIRDAKNSFDPNKQLSQGHVVFIGDIAFLYITWAKNLQFRQKVLEIPLLPIPNSALCPVTVLKLLLRTCGKQYHPLFGTGKQVTFTYAQFQRKLKKVLKQVGYKEKAFSSHSMRQGGVNFAHQAGVPEGLIQIHSDWLLDTYKAHLEYPVEIRALVSLMMTERILKSETHLLGNFLMFASVLQSLLQMGYRIE